MSLFVTTYQVPATELANRGYRILVVMHNNTPGAVSIPLDVFDEIFRGIAYMHRLPGVQRVVVPPGAALPLLWFLYADVAERGQRGPTDCQAGASSLPARPKVLEVWPSLTETYVGVESSVHFFTPRGPDGRQLDFPIQRQLDQTESGV